MNEPWSDVATFSSLMLPTWLTDAQIEIGSTPAELDGATARGVLWQAAPGRFLLDVPKVARYFVERGHHISIDPASKASESQIQQFLRMTPLAALLYQRGSLVFHASAVANANGVILLAGDSGVGKSTLLTVLVQRGWQYLADELAVIKLDGREQPIVLSTFPEIVLWQTAVEKLKVSIPNVVNSAGNNLNRHAMSMLDQFITEPKPLRAICWLTVRNTHHLETREVIGADRFQALGTLSYNSHIADALLDRVAYFRQASAIVRSVPIHRIERPRGRWSVEELADFVEQV
jgi:hypothetical protein